MTNEVQQLQITGNPTYGNFMLGFRDVFGAYLPFNPTASAIQANLEWIPTIGTGNVTVTDDTPVGAAFRIAFTNILGDQDVPALEVNRGDLPAGADAVIGIVTEGTLSRVPVVSRYEFRYRTVDTGVATSFAIAGITEDVVTGIRTGLEGVSSITEVQAIQTMEHQEYL